MLVPARTASATVQRLNAAIAESLHDPGVLAQLAAQAAEPIGGTPEQYAVFLQAEIGRWTAVAAENDLRLD